MTVVGTTLVHLLLLVHAELTRTHVDKQEKTAAELESAVFVSD